ncbi:MAG: Asp-tRNA(Asn)/Glu-tRNA(Gln) amidotransferase subunit GatC [Gemmatimonadota bacterium]
MSIGKDEVIHIARLAELAVSEQELPKLAEQLGRIVSFVEELNQAPAEETAPAYLAGPATTPLRPDEVNPVPLSRSPAEIAPAFVDGFFVVPRLGAMEEA